MLIKYVPNQYWRTMPSKMEGYNNQIILSGNNWNDYGYETSFNLLVVLNGKEYKDWSIKIQISDVEKSAEYLDKLCSEGWNGLFPIPNKKYISQFSDIDFYKTLRSVIGRDEAGNVLKIFKDAGYMKNIIQDSDSQLLINTSVFSSSLLRGTGSHKAYEEAWELFISGIESSIEDFTLNYKDRNSKIQKIKFKFSNHLLPTDINVLIGANGVGKSFTLNILAEFLLKVRSGDAKKLESEKFMPFDKRPKFSNFILISYSVFEEFFVDVLEEPVKDKESYKYFGLRARRSLDDQNPDFKKIGLGKQIPSQDATKAIFKMLYENYQFEDQDWWVNKFELANKTLKKGFDFDCIAIKIKDIKLLGEYDALFLNDEKYLIINEKLEKSYNLSNLEFSNTSETIEFIKNNSLLNLSSGQKLFSYIVLNILGEIKKQSLIVIDEPELFLHPTLEIEFIGLLKSILKPFDSKAILATHSLSIVREVPSRCVHIYREADWGLEILNPPFQTFGGDMQRISTYVFGDTMLKKPYENFLNNLLESGNYKPDKLIEKLGNDANEEMIMDIKIWENLNGN